MYKGLSNQGYMSPLFSLWLHEHQGQDRTFLSGKIIGGREAVPHSHPYMAFLRIQTLNTTERCGGFLVCEDFVVTAAHCWGSSINVTLGAHNIKEKERTQQIIPVKKAFPHPDYNSNYFNDIMLLQLEKKAKLTAEVSLLKLPSENSQVIPGMVCTLAGWERSGQNISTTKLHEVQLEIQKDKECLSRFKEPYNSTIHICVGNPKEKKASFKGDSGSPFVCKNVAQGIVSFGQKEGTPPSVYTRISSFRCWIKKTMKFFKLQAQD
uniref:LOW QUALITY PROTEIN: duodenase-1-like n=1 Tax=Ictidomys tridecemlineatus TaxID=43179 RepID=UPI0006825EDB|nr:LOW QUALITY PROTEIN: duodenase-1-like [Ictidomys tridecemlineatus]